MDDQGQLVCKVNRQSLLFGFALPALFVHVLEELLEASYLVFMENLADLLPGFESYGFVLRFHLQASCLIFPFRLLIESPVAFPGPVHYLPDLLSLRGIQAERFREIVHDISMRPPVGVMAVVEGKGHSSSNSAQDKGQNQQQTSARFGFHLTGSIRLGMELFCLGVASAGSIA